MTDGTVAVASDQAAFRPALIVFGLDDSGKPHASTFGEADVALAMKAAGLMAMHTLVVEGDELLQLAGGLPKSRVFASGKGFVPFVRQAIFDRLKAFAGPLSGPAKAPADLSAGSPGKRSDAPVGTEEAGTILPSDWSSISVGSVVLVSEGGNDGWYECRVVEARGKDLFVLRWRDWPELPVIVRKREHIALLNPATPSASAAVAA